MAKTWGKDIWEEKSKVQKGITVSGGITGLIRGKKKYAEDMKRIQNEIDNFMQQHPQIKNILEIGPGPDAINARHFLDKGYNLDLADVSPTALQKAKEKIGDRNVGLYEQDMITLKIPKKYDMVFCLGTFLHAPAHLAMVVMSNFNKQLKEGGFLMMDFPMKRKMGLKKWLWDGCYYLGHRIKTKITSKNFYVTCGEYTNEELDDIFQRTGFKLIQKNIMWVLQKI